MEVVRDDLWQVLYKDAQTSGRDDSVCVTMANSIWRYTAKARQMKEARSGRAIRLVSHKKQVAAKTSASKRSQLCQGKTKSGEPCRFKASCDGYCKKHISM
jgi:hypothetical protein